VIALLNDKFVPFAQTWRGPHEKWFSEASARFWKNWADDAKNVKAGQTRVGSGWLLGSQLVVTTSAGNSLTGRVGSGGVAGGPGQRTGAAGVFLRAGPERL
jgi:hypothetical protein